MWSGVAVVAAPDVEREQGLDHGAYGLLVFVLPLLGSALLEALVSVLADRYARPRVAAAGLLGLAVALTGCALVETSAGLALGLTLAGTASGVACAVAQAELVATAPGGPERAMLRWVLLGELGDGLTPLLTALVLSLGGTYRSVVALTAALAAGQGLALLAGGGRSRPASGVAHAAVRTDATAQAVADDPDPTEADPGDLPLLAALRQALGNGPLWLWLLAASLCTFLDELVIALAALHADRDLGASPAASVACVTGAAIGGALGAALGERGMRTICSARLLIGSALVTLVALGAVVLAPSMLALGASLALLGAAAAPQYALLRARAYAAEPGRPGVVNAVAQLFVVVDIVAPLALGALADRAGLRVALAALAAQPLGVLALLAWARRGRSSHADRCA